VGGERHLGAPQLRVEHGHLDCRLGHRMALDRRQPRSDVGGGERLGETRDHVLAQHELGRGDELGRVRRRTRRHALAPPFARSVAVVEFDAHEQDVALGLGAEARAERRDDRQRDPAQLDPPQDSGHGGVRTR
jgi:hypothetical protein